MAENANIFRDAMIDRTEAEWDALFDAISTVYSLRAGHVLSEDDIAALALVDKCHREDEETATDCYHRGREEAFRERGGDDLVAIHKRISDLEVKAATANTMKLLAESRAKSAAARAEASEKREAGAIEHLNRIIAVAPSLPSSFQWTGTDRAEDLFDAELRHASGKTPVDYLRAWLAMFRPFAFATRDDSWGELEKLIAITMNNVVKTLVAIKQAEVALSTTKTDGESA